MTHRLSLIALLFLGSVACKNGDPTCADRGEDEIRWFEDRDRDGYGNFNNFVEDCVDPDGNGPDGYVRDDTDCDDLRPEVYPTAPELCDGLDNNCNINIDDGLFYAEFWLDNDGDGYGDPQLQVAACDTPDGAADQPGDCNDGDAAVNPSAVEVCDEIDNDCDGFTDDDDDLPVAEGGVDLTTGLPFYPDADGDTYGSWVDADQVMACAAPEGYVADHQDCDDTDHVVNPDNTEICNGEDDDCDQLYDDSDPDLDTSTRTQYFIDADADGYGDPSESIFTCTEPWFYSTTDDDCDDDDSAVWSAADTVWLQDGDGDGFGDGDPSDPGCTPPANDWVPQALGVDCVDDDPAINPEAVEICDTLDNDCDGLIDDDDLVTEPGGVDLSTMSLWYVDADTDGYGDRNVVVPACAQPSGMVADDTDCDDADDAINPSVEEICDNIDNDCDFLTDDLDPSLDVDSGTLWVEDADGDGWGNLAVVERSCVAPFGFVSTYGDCDDTDPFLNLSTTWWFDEDGDGQGAGTVVAPADCDPPAATGWVPHYVGSPEDCAPDDPLALAGAEICYDGIDQGCDGNDFTSDGNCSLDLPENCAQAQLFNPIDPQDDPIVITGTLADAVNDIDFVDGDVCMGPTSRAEAGEEMVPITVEVDETIQVSLSIQGGDAQVYLLASCDSGNSCVAGADASGNQGVVERVEWTNDTGAEAIIYAVLDGNQFSDARAFTLTVEKLP